VDSSKQQQQLSQWPGNTFSYCLTTSAYKAPCCVLCADIGSYRRCRLLELKAVAIIAPISAIIYYGLWPMCRLDGRRYRLLSPMLAIVADVGARLIAAADVGCYCYCRCRLYLLPAMSAVIGDVGCCRADNQRCDDRYCHRCLLLSLSILSLMPGLLVRCLHSEINTAGHANALEIPLLLSPDGIFADVELDQRPIVGRGIR
jgi:hypothetical protein